MIRIAKIAPVTLSLILTVGLILPSMNANAGRIVIQKSNYQHMDRGRPGHAVPRTRHYRGVRVARPYGRPFGGYGYYYDDNDAYKWLAFTSITLKVLDNVNEEQQRLHEQAQVLASTANVGETIVWEDGDASGSVTTTRVGKSTSGRHCREFQQKVTIGGKTEQAYGTACLQPDGAWEIVQ